MPLRHIPAFIEKHINPANNVTRGLLLFVIMTAVRSGEARGAEWCEFDLEQAVWTVPARRWRAVHSSQALSAEGVATGEIAGEDAGTSSPKKHKPRKKRQDPLEPPPPPSEFQAWAYDRRDYFGFELIKQ